MIKLYDHGVYISHQHGIICADNHSAAVEEKEEARIDSWVLEHTLIFMDKRRKKLPGMRLAINISPFSVSNSHFHQQVKTLLEHYDIEPWQIIFELTENQIGRAHV